MFLKHFNTFVIFIFFYENLLVIDVIFSVHIYFFPCGSISKHFKLNISSVFPSFVFFHFFSSPLLDGEKHNCLFNDILASSNHNLIVKIFNGQHNRKDSKIKSK